MNKDQVRKFYESLWDNREFHEVQSILHERVTFRGSLGQEKRGHDGFIDYVNMVHGALADYKCVIEDLIEEGNKVCAKMLFTGIHKDEFLGYPGSGQRITWMGCAIFTFDGSLIVDVWVLGDLNGLLNQLEGKET